MHSPDFLMPWYWAIYIKWIGSSDLDGKTYVFRQNDVDLHILETVPPIVRPIFARHYFEK